MRNTLLDPYEHLPRSVVVTANDYPAGSTFPAHTHLRGQFAMPRARRHQRGDAASLLAGAAATGLLAAGGHGA